MRLLPSARRAFAWVKVSRHLPDYHTSAFPTLLSGTKMNPCCRRVVTELAHAHLSTQDGGVPPRWGVWDGDPREAGSKIVATGDNLNELCQFYGLDPRLDRLAVPALPHLGND